MSAFYQCSFESIRIPDSVISIEEGAFYLCGNLTTVVLGNSLETIGERVFHNCYDLKSINFPNSLVTIKDNAFNSCWSLETVSLGDSLEYIGESAFSECYSLNSVNVSENNKNFTSFDGALYNKTLTNLILCPSGKTEINFPEGLTSISDFALRGCSNLSAVSLPASVESVGKGAFCGCSSLQTIDVSKENSFYASYGGVLFDKNLTTLVCWPLSNWDFSWPESVTTIGEYAFAYNYNIDSPLSHIELPNTVKTIGKSAFQESTGLLSIKIPDSVTEIEDSVFNDCIFLNNVEIGNSLLSIGESAFSSCFNLSSIKLPDSLISLGERAFAYCSSLENLEFGNSLEIIKDYAFSSCENLKTLKLPDSLISLGTSSFSSCYSLETIHCGKSLKYIDLGAFWNCASLKNIYLPNSLTYIGNQAFSQCESLESITIPESVSEISDGAFKNNPQLSEVICQALVVPEIGFECFDGIKSEASLYVFENVIEDYENSEWAQYFFQILPIDNSSIPKIFLNRNENFYDVYNLNGLKILTTSDSNDLKRLSNGIYIINGKKYKIGLN